MSEALARTESKKREAGKEIREYKDKIRQTIDKNRINVMTDKT
jgi:hypothetical protein